MCVWGGGGAGLVRCKRCSGRSVQVPCSPADWGGGGGGQQDLLLHKRVLWLWAHGRHAGRLHCCPWRQPTWAARHGHAHRPEGGDCRLVRLTGGLVDGVCNVLVLPCHALVALALAAAMRRHVGGRAVMSCCCSRVMQLMHACAGQAQGACCGRPDATPPARLCPPAVRAHLMVVLLKPKPPFLVLAPTTMLRGCDTISPFVFFTS